MNTTYSHQTFTRKMSLLSILLSLFISGHSLASLEEYKFDIKGQHAFIQFKIKHLGYSWLLGEFNRFDGSFSLDTENPERSSVDVTIDMSSIDTNHAERDKHLRGKDFFNVEKFPQATYKSTSITKTGDESGIISGMLTLNGIEKQVDLTVNHIGGGKDPWGGFRRGFEATGTIVLKEFGMNYDLGPSSTTADLFISIEGIKQ